MTSNGMNGDEKEANGAETSPQRTTSPGASPFPDLWGELPSVINVRTPKRILNEQALALGNRTRQVLNAKVTTRVLEPDFDHDSIQHDLSIIAPFLNNYKVTIVQASHSVTSAYPAIIIDVAGGMTTQQCDDAHQFEQALKAVLQSNHVHEIIAGLLTHSRDYVA